MFRSFGYLHGIWCSSRQVFNIRTLRSHRLFRPSGALLNEQSWHTSFTFILVVVEYRRLSMQGRFDVKEPQVKLFPLKLKWISL